MAAEALVINYETGETFKLGTIKPGNYAKIPDFDSGHEGAVGVYCHRSGNGAEVFPIDGESDDEVQRLVCSGEAFSDERGAVSVDPITPYQRRITNPHGATGLLVLSLVVEH